MQKVSERRFVSRLTRDTLALVLAGGRGSRLKQLTGSRCKPAVHFGGKYRIIDFTLSNCINTGIRRIGVLTQYKSQSLIRHLQLGWGFLRGEFGEFVEVLPAELMSDIGTGYRGTADAVYQNLDFVMAHQPAYVLVLAGDHIYKMDYGAMLAHHVERGAQVTVGCIEVPLEDARDFGVLSIDERDRVLEFVEKSPTPKPMPGDPETALASMGIYVFDARFLLDLLTRDAGINDSSHDFGKDVVPNLVGHADVYAYRFRDLYDSSKPGYWRDVGTVDAFWKANLELTNVVPELNLYDTHWPIWTQQEQVPPAKFVFDDVDSRGFAVDSLVSGGCIVSGAAVVNSVLFVNARIESGSVVAHSLLLPEAHVGERCRINNAIIDAGVRVPDGTVIGENPEDDRRRFSLSRGGVTLVTREMLRD